MTSSLASNLTAARTHYKGVDGPCGLTQEQLAERCGMTAKAVSDIECGKVPVPQKLTMARLAEALDTTIEVLMDHDP